jgi:uncharacterized protein YgiM (DUF1202 family)
MILRPSVPTAPNAPLGRRNLPTVSIRKKKNPRLARQLYAAKYDVNQGTEVLALTRTASEKVKTKVKRAREYFVSGLVKTRAMMRGVSWALANWKATSKAEERKTMNVNIDEAIVPSTVRAFSGVMFDFQPIASSILCRRTTDTMASTILNKGSTQMEFSR